MKISELLKDIEVRPLAFLNQKNLEELDAFLRGFRFAFCTQRGIVDDEFTFFETEWLKKKYKKNLENWKLYYNKYQVEKAFTIFFKDWNEYVNEISFPPIT